MESLAKYEGNNALAMSPSDVMSQVTSIQSLMEKAMKNGEHYGTIPGCGDKPALLKAGAEKLTFMFRLAPKYEIQERDLANGHKEYRVVTTLIHIPTGNFAGEGLGICSTLETKYRYRNAAVKCPECGKEAIIKGKKEYGGGWLCFKKKGGCGAKFQDGDESIENQEQGKVEYENPADYYNTVLKMAKKRSLVDATLTSTAASDIFTQDIEELVENGAIVIKDQSNEDKKDRNYTAEAEACKTLNDLKKWWETLSGEEKGKLEGLKNYQKEQIQKSSKKSNEKKKHQLVLDMIQSLTKKTFERDHQVVENSIDAIDSEDRSMIEEKYIEKIKALGIDYEYAGLPF